MFVLYKNTIDSAAPMFVGTSRDMIILQKHQDKLEAEHQRMRELNFSLREIYIRYKDNAKPKIYGTCYVDIKDRSVFAEILKSTNIMIENNNVIERQKYENDWVSIFHQWCINEKLSPSLFEDNKGQDIHYFMYHIEEVPELT